MFAGNFAPVGWFLCQGQSLAISSYQVLYQLIGTTYGGNGTTTFNLPNLASRSPIHVGAGGGGTYLLGSMGGAENVTLTVAQIPAHAHLQAAQTAGGTTASPAGAFPATPSPAETWYTTNAPNAAEALATPAMTTAGSSQPHNNMQPFLVINFIIAWQGIYPSA
jgi:microcystin-dependent protein